MPWRNVAFVEQSHDVIRVEVSGEYQLRLTFDDDTVADVDFSGREWRGVFAPLRVPDYFARVTVDAESGAVTWPNGADMAPEPLYTEARQNLLARPQPDTRFRSGTFADRPPVAQSMVRGERNRPALLLDQLRRPWKAALAARSARSARDR